MAASIKLHVILIHLQINNFDKYPLLSEFLAVDLASESQEAQVMLAVSKFRSSDSHLCPILYPLVWLYRRDSAEDEYSYHLWHRPFYD